MSVRGYAEVRGGTVRIIISQTRVGFTSPQPTGCAFNVPLLHRYRCKWSSSRFSTSMVDDPEARRFVTRLALDFRNTFK